MRRAFMVLVATIASVVLVVAHGYLALRLAVQPRWPAPLESALLIVFLSLALSIVGFLLAERFVPVPWIRVIAWGPALWMGAAWLWLFALLATDFLLLLVGADGQIDLLRSRALLLVVAFVAFAAYAAPRAMRAPPIRRVEVTLPRWPRALDGYRIAQISDVHIGPLLGRSFAADVTRRVNALKADLAVVTGDLVDGPVRLLRDEVAPFRELSARDGVFFTTGNHDHYSRADPWVACIQDLGWTVLRNTRVRLTHGDVGFDLIGVEDHDAARVSEWREDLPAAVDGRDPTVPAILLAHDPRTFPRAVDHSIDLQLSGHTHGGQLYPFGFLVRLVIPYLAGLYRRENSQLYVSRGTGFWGPPLRLGAPAEITELVLLAPAPGAEASSG